MGKYINGEGMRTHGKARWCVVNIADTREVTLEEAKQAKPDEAVICVVNNGFFEAACYCANSKELEACNHPSDHRLKTWLLAPRDKVEEIAA